MNPVHALLLVLAVLPLLLPVRAASVTVFAGASLTDSLQEIAATYEQQSGDRIIFNFAGSGILVRQIEAGAPADLFFSADETRADQLARQGKLVPCSRVSLLSNVLVLITPSDLEIVRSPSDLTRPEVRRLALGHDRTVPAGAYARAHLQRLNLWSALESRVIPFDNVRAVLAAVESGNVDAGIVYRTDVAAARRVRIAFEFAAHEDLRISYPVVLLRDAPHPEAARRFLECLRSDAAAAVFRRHGFLVTGDDPRGFADTGGPGP
jgi:molybdate transport system substrate-binding protein